MYCRMSVHQSGKVENVKIILNGKQAFHSFISSHIPDNATCSAVVERSALSVVERLVLSISRNQRLMYVGRTKFDCVEHD